MPEDRKQIDLERFKYSQSFRSLAERLSTVLREVAKRREVPSVDLELTPEVSEQLRKFLLRPNPTLAEATFLGIGDESLISELLIPEGEKFSSHSGIFKAGLNHTESDVWEEKQLLNRAYQEGKLSKILLRGHSHPTGVAVINGVQHSFSPAEYWLDASSGDLEAWRYFAENNPIVDSPYVGIGAVTQDGPKLRVYSTPDIVKVKKWSNIRKVPQKTINL